MCTPVYNGRGKYTVGEIDFNTEFEICRIRVKETLIGYHEFNGVIWLQVVRCGSRSEPYQFHHVVYGLGFEICIVQLLRNNLFHTC